MFDNFAPVYVINLNKRKDRKKYIEETFNEYNINDYTFIDAIDGNFLPKNIILKNDHKLTNYEIAASLSHLKAIKSWVDSSNSKYAIICEDDISLKTSEYWGFSWNDFINSIDFNFDVIQLSILFTSDHNLFLHKRKNKEYSAAIYLIKREHAIKIINKYFINNYYNLNYDDEEILPDHYMIYNFDTTYSFPLFITNESFGSDLETFDDKSVNKTWSKKERKNFNENNCQKILLMWKTNTYSLKELLSMKADL